MLTFIVMVGVLTASVVFSATILLKIANFSSVKQAELQAKQRMKNEI
ncbi:hypothetical protein LGK95_02725 [Clostridium algoriphilum]|nr:hypothetical protein [Clostridium algoriphilum]MCB2292454.1 hypothetical protein [Clostridium algoriphilum]